MQLLISIFVVRDVFYRMGFNDQEIVILSGAHALGVSPDSSASIHSNLTFR